MITIETLVLIGILLLITLINLKIAIRYIDRKQAKKTIKTNDKDMEIHSVEDMENNFEKILADLLSKKRQKFAVYWGEGIVGVFQTIETYQKEKTDV